MPLNWSNSMLTMSQKLSGGHGAVREICELMMQAQGTYDAQMAQYLA